MERVLDSLKQLKRWQIGLLAAVVVGAFGATFGVYNAMNSSGQDGLGENQRLIPIQFGNLINEVAINGSIAFSNKETLNFGAAGTVAEILVDEGEEVTEGQSLVKLDVETIAELQQAVAQSRLNLMDAERALDDARSPALQLAQAETAVADANLALQDAQEELDSLLVPDALAITQAEAAVADANLALQDAQEEIEGLLEPDSQAVAEAESAVIQARISLRDAELAVGKDVVDAVSDFNAATKDLDAASEDLRLALNNSNLRQQQKNFDEAQQEYLDAFKKWTGVVLTDEELTQSPQALFDAWGFDPEVLFDRKRSPVASAKVGDDPSTRWNEMTIYAWLRLYPGANSIEITCDDRQQQTNTNVNSRAVVVEQDLCIQRDFDEAWEVYEGAIEDMDRLQSQSVKDIANAEAGIIRAEETLAQAQKVMDGLTSGPEAELLKKNFLLAQAVLGQAEIDLEELIEPDLAEVNSKENQVALAQANLAQAKEDLAMLLEPDPLEVASKRNQVALAQATLDDAKASLDGLQAKGEIEIALREAEVASAQASLKGATLRFEKSTLKAPFNGFVSLIDVEEGEEVNATTAIVQVIDPSIVKVEGVVDEIDVLSLRQGAQASVTMDALRNQALDGKVSRVSSSASSQQGVVTFAVEIEVTVPEEIRLQEGLSAVANVMLSVENGLLIPSQAVQGTFDNPQVLVMNGRGIESRSVVLGGSDGFWSVVQRGLNEGEQVVIEVSAIEAQQVGFRGFGGGGGGGTGGGAGGTRR